MIVGLGGVSLRVVSADGEPFAAVADSTAGIALLSLSDEAPAMALADQRGETISLDAMRGRPIIVTFAHAHCDTVCPQVVEEARVAQARVADRRPVLLIVTLDPSRDTPARLASIARPGSSAKTRTCCRVLPPMWIACSMRGIFRARANELIAAMRAL